MTATLEVREDAPATEAPEPQPPSPQHPVPEALRPWRDPHPRLGWAVTALVTLVAGFTRFWAIGFPSTRNFDEAYYAVEAQELLRYGYEDNRGYMFIVHPPLGKWLIALTEWLHDATPSEWLTNSVGWRIAPALAGIAGIVMLTRTARRMFRSNLFGGIAGLLTCFEGVSLVLARTAILDIFLQTFVIASFAALVLDRDQVRGRLARLLAEGADLSRGAPSLGPRPWRLVGGVMIALASGVKWTGAYFFAAFVILSLLWDRSALRAAGVQRPTRSWLRRSVAWAPGPLLLAPIGTYLLCWLGWFTGEDAWNRYWADDHGPSATLKLPLVGWHVPFSWGWVPGPIRALGSYHLQAYRFHEGLDSPHIYGSKPWSWLVLGRPVDFYYNDSSKACGAAQCSREVLLIGTPLLWWAFLPALLWIGWHWITTRDWRAGAVIMAFIAGWVVWFGDLKRTMFLFYMAPLLPFLVLGLTMALGALLGPRLVRTGHRERDRRATVRRRWGVIAVSVFLGVVVADFAWMWPLFTGALRTHAQWQAHMWFDSWV
ncbi:MAG: dolichyl-phosphate-mannose--protein mannosyltransferase [Jatrophihabitans sp.]|uniref:dolichyl-phosphate-mannose--protein mannosyltransferase n=1 Tax=Jatrophihabitans sp. TaxID=1932789 RepID=UPI003F81833F